MIDVFVHGKPFALINNPDEFASMRAFIVEDQKVLDKDVTLGIKGLHAWAANEVKSHARAIRSALTGNADAYELAGWAGKAERAHRAAAGSMTPADKAAISTEAKQRGLGETPEDLLAKQAAKADSMGMAVAVIDGLESAALREVATTDSLKELTALLGGLSKKSDAAISQLMAK